MQPAETWSTKVWWQRSWQWVMWEVQEREVYCQLRYWTGQLVWILSEMMLFWEGSQLQHSVVRLFFFLGQRGEAFPTCKNFILARNGSQLQQAYYSTELQSSCSRLKPGEGTDKNRDYQLRGRGPSHFKKGAPLPPSAWKSKLPKLRCSFAIAERTIYWECLIAEDFCISGFPDVPAD
jgi:hypothetical protein